MTVSPDGMNLKYQHKIGLLWKPYVLKGRRSRNLPWKSNGSYIGWRESPSGFERREEDGWLARPPGCLPEAEISKRTLQTLRDNGTLAYTKIGNRTYYLPEDVERIVTKVEDRRKDARYRGHTIWRNWTEVSTKDKWAVCIIEFISNNWLKRSLIYLCDLKSSIDVLRQDSPPS